MSELSERLAHLEKQLDELRKIKTQEDFDEGARLHNAKNAPWVSGPFADMVFPPYVFRAFPKHLYHPDYNDACKAFDEAHLIPARGSEDGERSKAIMLAQRWKDATTKEVTSQAEEDALRGQWFESPSAAYAAKQAAQTARATAEAHRAYEDRNMGESARREISAIEEAAEDFVPEIPQQRKAGARQKVTA